MLSWKMNHSGMAYNLKKGIGNIAKEDVVNLFAGMAVKTGIDLKRISEASDYYGSFFGRDLPGRMSRVLKTL